MADTVLNKLISAGSIGSSVYRITDNTSDAAAAAGYGAWVESITGALPYVENLGDNRARVYLSDVQTKIMSNWLENKFQSVIVPKKKELSSLEIDFNGVVSPIAIKYIAVFSALFFLTGWIARGTMK